MGSNILRMHRSVKLQVNQHRGLPLVLSPAIMPAFEFKAAIVQLSHFWELYV